MRILFVEDEPLIRIIVSEAFADHGFAVQDAASGDEAAALIRNGIEPFSLLVTDVHMPGSVDGLALARLVRERLPAIPVIYTTGRPDIFRRSLSVGEPELLISKPYLPSELVAAARRLTGGAGE